jgi:membrane protease YdiL (CAAX protease family)
MDNLSWEAYMTTIRQKALAIFEVIFVTFAVIPVLSSGIYRLFPRLSAWQTTVGFNVPIFFYILSTAMPILLALAQRRSLTEYGIDFHNLKHHLDIMLVCFLPVALTSLLCMKVDPKSWNGALILAIAQGALLLVLAWLLRNRPTAVIAGFLGVGFLSLIVQSQAGGSNAWKALTLFVNYAVFVGFGEEILFRGYIQSRLNEVFGRPFSFYGVSFGWGVLITNLLFGLMHVGIVRWILGINQEVTLAWGVWTIFSGMVFSFVREKTGSILAPALLHGLPQAIARVAMLFLTSP